MSDYGFELIRELEIPEINTAARWLRHTRTGAQVISMENDDENKVFGVAFGTPTADSTGLPHIMEHSVLGGSRKYPVKEPFVELNKGSLKTFVNAFTYSDKTIYPVASQNVRDFYNLIDVYMDAVFYPNISPHTLQQEGWHYELDALDAPLVYKGVVFNEMKGAYSDAENLFYRLIERSLFPDHPYFHDSGGNPVHIPDLTYEQFKRYHETYYHPANALIWFYGDDDPAERLRIVHEYVNDFDPLAVDASIPLCPPFAEPQREVIPYVASPDEAGGNRDMLAVNWALAEGSDAELMLAFHILDHILIGTPASPLRKTLIDSGLGEDLASFGLDPSIRQVIFSTGLKGIAPTSRDEVEALVLDALAEIANDGIDPGMVEAAVNTIEFRLRENNTGSFPRGLMLMIRALRTWRYDGDPFAPLAFDAPLQAIKDRLAAGEPYFETLIRRYLIENPHRSTLIMTPDPELGSQREAAERERLAQVRASMDDAALQRILEETAALKRLQETPDSPEALATIPALQLDDLDREIRRIPLALSDLHGSQMLYHDLFTNGILYLDVGFDVHTLPQALVPYLGVFGRALLEMGTATENFVQLAQRIGRTTGGIRPYNLSDTVMGTGQSVVWSLLRGKSTVEHAADLLAILRDVLLTANLDNAERLRQIVLEEKARLESRLLPMGHGVIRLRMEAHLSEAEWFSEQTSGIAQLFFLRDLAQQIEQDWPTVHDALETIRSLLINRQAMLCNATLDADNWAQVEPLLAEFVAGLPAATPDYVAWSPSLEMRNEGLVVPANVNYVGKAANLYELGYELHGSILPLLRYLQTTWLWERVRAQGGAYGAYAVFDSRSGAFSYLSYRDPNLLATLDNYTRTSEFVRNLAINDDELRKTIIGSIGVLDAYQLPDAKAYTSLVRHLTGFTDAIRQQYRDEVLATTGADLVRYADVLDEVNRTGLVVVLGGEDALTAANAERGGDWLPLTRVL